MTDEEIEAMAEKVTAYRRLDLDRESLNVAKEWIATGDFQIVFRLARLDSIINVPAGSEFAQDLSIAIARRIACIQKEMESL